MQKSSTLFVGLDVHKDTLGYWLGHARASSIGFPSGDGRPLIPPIFHAMLLF